MSVVFIPRTQYLGLCAYVNQAELSLDRTRSDARSALTDFYRTRVRQPVELVVKSLQRLLGQHDVRDVVNWADYARSSTSSASVAVVRIFSFVTWHVVGGVYLSIHTLSHVVDALDRFAGFLAAPEGVSKEDMIEIRLHLAMVGSTLDRRLPSRSLAVEVRSVSHLNQAEHLKFKGVEEIARAKWSRTSGKGIEWSTKE